MDDLIEHPDIDTTFINLEEEYPIYIRPFSTKKIEAGLFCRNEGFIGGQMPGIVVNWSDSGLVISSCEYNTTIANGEGYIKSKKIMTVNAVDIKIENVNGLETSYGGTQGMSGGPLINTQTDEIIGLMSIGLPADVQIKHSLFAVAIDEINKKI